MGAQGTRRRKTTLVSTKAELLSGRHVVDITDERLAELRRADYQTSFGHASSIHRPLVVDEPGAIARWWRRVRGRPLH